MADGWSDSLGRHIGKGLLGLSGQGVSAGTLHVELGLKSSPRGQWCPRAADLAHVELDVAAGRQQRGVDEQPAHVDAVAVAGLRDLQPVLDRLGARDQRVDAGRSRSPPSAARSA